MKYVCQSFETYMTHRIWNMILCYWKCIGFCQNHGPFSCWVLYIPGPVRPTNVTGSCNVSPSLSWQKSSKLHNTFCQCSCFNIENIWYAYMLFNSSSIKPSLKTLNQKCQQWQLMMNCNLNCTPQPAINHNLLPGRFSPFSECYGQGNDKCMSEGGHCWTNYPFVM